MFLAVNLSIIWIFLRLFFWNSFRDVISDYTDSISSSKSSVESAFLSIFFDKNLNMRSSPLFCRTWHFSPFIKF